MGSVPRQLMLRQHHLLLQAALMKAGESITASGIDLSMLPTLDHFECEVVRDPFSNTDTLNGRWVPQGTQRRGSFVINSDGTLMLEIDLICQMADEKWAESVSVWGNGIEELRSEINPMQML